MRLTHDFHSAETDPAYDQISLRPFYFWQGKIQPTERPLSNGLGLSSISTFLERHDLKVGDST